MSLILLIIIICICIFLEGFFSGSELALVVADKLRLKNRAMQGDVQAKMTEHLLENPKRLFGTTLFGTNLCTITATTVLTYFIITHFGNDYSVFALLLSPVILIFGEVLPKSIYQHHANYLVAKVGAVLVWVSYIFFPFVWLLSKLTDLLIGGIEKSSHTEPRISREELAEMLSSKEVSNSDMPPQERKLIKTVLELSEDEVENIMIPLVDIEMLPITSDIDAAFSLSDLKGLSKIPVFEHRSYNIVGIVDVTDCIFADKNKKLQDIMKQVLYVPENMPLYELYETLQDHKEDLAVVVDEYGGATGFVTLEDLLEEIFGEIQDEYELEEQYYKKILDNLYLVSGRMEIEEANEELDLGIPYGDYETLAGYLLDLFSYIPKKGESVEDNCWRYTVKKASPKAILEIEIMKIDEACHSRT